MNNVDTLTLGLNLEDKVKLRTNLKGERIERTDFKTVKRIDRKIKEKLYCDKANREKRKKQFLNNSGKRQYKSKAYVYWYGKHKGYNYCYNETLHTLSIMLKHYRVEKYSAEEILENVRNELMKFFDLEAEDLTPLTLRRIDYYCDYRYRSEEELLVIKEIVNKVTDGLYTYKKEVMYDSKGVYVVKYLSF